MTPLNNLLDYSELGVCDGPLDRLADPVDVPGTRPGKGGSPAGGSLLTGSPGSRRPAGGAPGSNLSCTVWGGFVFWVGFFVGMVAVVWSSWGTKPAVGFVG